MLRLLLGLLKPADERRRDDAYERAIAELNAYTDRELADLGISRGEIRSAVRHGRPGIDRPLTGVPANEDARQVRAA